MKSEEDSRFLSRITGRFNWNLGLLRSKAKQAARKLQWALGRAAGMINSAICFPAFCGREIIQIIRYRDILISYQAAEITLGKSTKSIN